MLLTITKTTLCIAFLLAATTASLAGDRVPQSQPVIAIAYTPDGKPAKPTSKVAGGVRVAGAECPTGSGSYCSDELPYCCPGVSVDPYCAKDVNGCTQ